MDFKPVYECLMGLFPHLDSRILKAVAIENYNDLDAAVDIVLTDILFFSLLVGFLLPTKVGSNLEEESDSLWRRVRSGKTVGSFESKSTSISKGDCDGSDADQADPTCVEVTLSKSKASCCDIDADQLQADTENEELILLGADDKHVQTASSLSCEASPDPLMHDNTHSFAHREGEVSSSVSECQDSDVVVAQGEVFRVSSTSLIVENGGSGTGHLSELDDVEDPVDYYECNVNLLTHGTNLEVEARSDDWESEPGNNVIKPIPDTAEDGNSAESSHPEIVNCSYNDKIKLLEEMIEAARHNKKAVLSAMELVTDTMRRVEHEERAAEQLKEEAARGGSDISVEVEEIKQLLAHAKQANDMHAGEVYIEKAILATEARELRSRLVNLANERDNALSILDELKQMLEARLAPAEEMRKAAEQERWEKQESALSALAAQQAVMDKVVQESKTLQQEAEENSKLREFLVDRGHVLDTLQGEMAVICQDVKSLKEKIDNRVPLTKSISSSQTNCISVHVSDPMISSRSPKGTSPTCSVNGQSPKSSHEGQRVAKTAKELIDDGWDFFDL